MTTPVQPTKREVLLAAAFTAALMLAAIIAMARSGACTSADLIGIYTPALLIRQGHAEEIYSPQAQARVQKELFNRPSALLGIHPPFEFALLAPLTRLSFRTVYVLIGVMDVALWMLFMVLIRPHAPVPRNPFRFILFCWMFFPAWVGFLQGQPSLLMLAAWTLAFLFMKRRQDFCGGLFMGLGLFKFAVALPFALICLLRGKWRLLAGFAVTALALGGLAAAVTGVAGVRSYVDLLLAITRDPGNAAFRVIEPIKMPTIRGFLNVTLAGAASVASLNAAAALISVPLILYMAWRWRREDRRPDGGAFDLMFAASLVVSEVVAPHLLAHDLTVVLLPLLLVVGSPQLPRARAPRFIVITAVVILYVPLYLFWLPHGGLFLLGPVLLAFALAASQLPALVSREA